MSAEYRDKLASLHFGPRRAESKVTVEGDRREGSVVTETDDRQNVEVFIPPVANTVDTPMWAEMQEQAADTAADRKREET